METTIKNRQFEVAEIQLSNKTKVKPSQHLKITSSKDAYFILLESVKSANFGNDGEGDG